MIEEDEFPDGAFRTAWGVADEHLFDRAIAELDSLDATGRPSFTLVLTVSNHRPYTYPPGRIPQDPASKRRSHAVHYADWALGRFMAEAQRHRFYHHTLFVLMGDHGARVYGAAEIPLHSYEVPILLVAPGVVPAGVRVAILTSSLDLPPTVLGLHRATRVFRVTPGDSLRPLAAPDPGTDPVGDAVAYVEGADRLYRSGALRVAPAGGGSR